MTLSEAIAHVRQNLADKLSGNEIVTGTTFLADAINLHVIPRIVSLRDWSWKYDYLDHALPANTWSFTPPPLGTSVFYDDLYAIVVKTGDRATTRAVRGRDLRWFIERYPDPSLLPAGRPDWFTVIGESGSGRFEVRFNRPTDAAYTVQLVYLKTFAPVALNEQLPLRPDRHMIVVAGATSYAFASIEQFESARPWFELFTTALDLWWAQDQARSHVETKLGRYQPGVNRLLVEDYWKNPFVQAVTDTGE